MKICSFICSLVIFGNSEQIYLLVTDNTMYSYKNHLKIILKDLKYDMETFLRWFKEKLMKANPKKLHV